MATFGSMTYFLKVGQEPTKCKNDRRMTNSAPNCVLINDPKKLFQKKLYVTIPQWSETFPSMSDLSSGHNSAKCGLQLNDPIDWFKLRLNQPKIFLGTKPCTSISFSVSTTTCGAFTLPENEEETDNEYAEPNPSCPLSAQTMWTNFYATHFSLSRYQSRAV